MSYHLPVRTGHLGGEIRRNADIVGFGMLLLFGGGTFAYQALYGYASFFLFGISADTDLIEQSVSLAAYILSFALPILAVAFFTRIQIHAAFPAKALRLSVIIPGVMLSLGISVFGGFVSGLISNIIQIVFGYVPVMPDMYPPAGTASVCVYVFSIVVAPAFLEEMMFRGVILQSLRRFGDGFALVVSSILFAMAHGNLVQGPNSFVVGLVIGFFVLRTGSIWAGIVIHFINNLIVVAFELVTRHAPAPVYQLAVTALTCSFIALGVLAVIYLFFRYPAFFRLAPSHVSVSEPRKYALFFTSAMPVAALIAVIFITSRYFIPVQG